MTRPTPALSAALAVAAAARNQEGGPRQVAIDRLTEGVLEAVGTPIDTLAVAATLESRGLRDVDAVARYGYPDLFKLADEVYLRARAWEPAQPSWTTAELETLRLRSFVRPYLRGGFSYMPLLFQVVLLLTVGYSQWGWVHFTITQASIVAVAAGLSFLATAPFVQSIGYLGPIFGETGKHRLALRSVCWAVAGGTLATAVIAALLAVVARATGAYSLHQLEIASVYSVLIALLWLLNSVLYMLKRPYVMIVSLGASAAVVGLVLHLTSWGIYAAHWFGLACASIVNLVWVLAILGRRAAATSEDMRLARMPRRSLLIARTAPMVIYGFSYYLMMLADRGIAWSAGNHRLPVLFNVHYELGLDLALFAAALGTAFLECGVFAVTKLGLPRQERFAGGRGVDYNRWLARLHRRNLVPVVALTCLGAAIIVTTLVILHDNHSLGALGRFYSDPVARRVFAFAVLGYGLIAVGAASTSVLFMLGRPRLAARAVSIGVVVDLVTGYVLSRSAGFSFAVIGLVAGGGAFAVFSGYWARGVLRSADFNTYAAY